MYRHPAPKKYSWFDKLSKKHVRLWLFRKQTSKQTKNDDCGNSEKLGPWYTEEIGSSVDVGCVFLGIAVSEAPQRWSLTKMICQTPEFWLVFMSHHAVDMQSFITEHETDGELTKIFFDVLSSCFSPRPVVLTPWQEDIKLSVIFFYFIFDCFT